MTHTLRYFYRGQVQSVNDAPPTRTILQQIREGHHCTGTKEGCAEGDCGACTVLIAELKDDEVKISPVNSCIQFLPSLHGKALLTVEDLTPPDAPLHPVQQAMVDCHGSQCGFCTPGFVMSLWSLYLKQQAQTAPLTRTAIDDALSGNLCRCTGYKPIIEAAQRMLTLPPTQFDYAALKENLLALQAQDDAPLSYCVDGHSFHAPRTVTQLLALREKMPNALLVSGSTDVGLWVTKQMRELPEIIYLNQVTELQQISEQPTHLEIGAAVTLNDAYAAICAHYPQLKELWQRFASLPIRNAGTLVGNIANGSPIGDSAPWMIALGCEVVLRSVCGQRVLALENFYLDYQKKDLRPDEFVEAVRVPLASEHCLLRTYKLAKRFDQDISAVCAAFCVTLDGDRVVEARIAYGGMAATSKRAARAEATLREKAWNDEAVIDQAIAALAQDYAPLSDMRASSNYRMRSAQNLLRRYWLETRTDAPLPASALNVFQAIE